MLSIRLVRTGKKKQPSYRIVVAEKAKALHGSFVEIVGNYNPRTKELRVDSEKYSKWLSQGAKPSATVAAIIKKSEQKS